MDTQTLPASITGTPDGATFAPQTGLDPGAYRRVAEALGPVLADSYLLFIKTQGLHWNVSGGNFYGVHQLTEKIYQELYEALDVLAERIRALGQPAPASYASYGRMSRIADTESAGAPADQVRGLIADNGILCDTLRAALAVAEEDNDVVTVDLLTQRLGKHEQYGWMLEMLVS
ncbi:MAG: DNA starvation/stationary phase protection protein [Sphingomonadales bacterium]|jgi:starvation-inducible DNA-binding protein